MTAKKSTAVARDPRPRALEDTAVRALDPEIRSKLGMDAWEPSLLRHLLEAEGKLPAKR